MIHCADGALERLYVGGALVQPDILTKHPVMLDALAFETNRRVLECAMSVYARDGRITENALDAELSERGWLRGARVLSSLAGVLDDPGEVARRLRDLAKLRQVHEGAERLAQSCRDGAPVADVKALASALHEAAEHVGEGPAVSHVADVVRHGIESLISRQGKRSPIVPTGIPDLDAHVGGWVRGDMTVIGGDPSAGKSTTMLLAALTQAAAGHKPGIVSIEDGRERWFRRMAATIAGIPIRQLKDASLSADDFSRVQILIDHANALDLYFAWAIGSPLEEVVSAIRTLIARGCDVIYVDYLQAIEGGYDEKAFRLFVRRCLTAFRRESNQPGREVPIVIGSQFRKRDDEESEPKNSDLYEAAYIHQKADSIVLLWREKAYRRWVLSKAKDDEIGKSGVLWRDPRSGLLISEAQALGIGLDRKLDRVSERQDRNEFSDEGGPYG